MELEPVAPSGPDVPAPEKRTSRLPLYLVLAVLVAIVAAVLVLRRPPSAEDELRALRAFVESSKTAHFEGTSRAVMGPGADELGSTSVETARVEGDLQLPRSGRYVLDDGDYEYETLVIDDLEWSRETYEEDGELADEKWVEMERAEEQALQELGAAPTPEAMAAMSLFDVAGAPLELKNLLGRLKEVERGEGSTLEASTTVRALLSAEELDAIEDLQKEMEANLQEQLAEVDDDEEREAMEEEMKLGIDSFSEFLDNTVTVTLHHTGERLDRLVLVVKSRESIEEEDEAFNETTDVRFSRWGEPVKLEPPTPAEIDQTPEIDEEALQAFSAFQAVMLASPPVGMVVESAATVEEDAESETCASVEISYTAPYPEDEADIDAMLELKHLAISEYAPGCEWLYYEPEDVAKGKAVQISGVPARIVESEYSMPGDDAIVAVFDLNGVHFEVETNLAEPELLQALSNFVPLDTDDLVAALG